MKQSIRLFTTAAAALGLCASAQATLVTINMTADNIVNGGGLCADASCQTGTGWGFLGTLSNADDWRNSDSITVDLGAGTHYFAWRVVNVGSPGPGNPAALLAEILWSGNANRSSSAWEVYDQATGAFLELATAYGTNGGANIWTTNNGGSAVAGIDTSAEWIYTSSNFSEADEAAWLRTSIRIVPEPGALGLLAGGLLVLGGLGALRRRRIAT